MTLAQFKARLATVQLQRTAFLDDLGRFAKEPEAVDSILCEFVDGTTFTLSSTEFNALTTSQREQIRNDTAQAYSGPVPNPDASNA